MTGRILLVEDDAAIRGILTELLRARGHNVDTALDGPAGLRMAGEHHYDIIILAMTLPGMTGFEVFEVLGFTGGIILLTTLGQRPAGQWHAHLRIDLELVKPFDPAQLLAGVDELLRARGNAATV